MFLIVLCERSTDKINARKALERKEQYKQVRAHVKKDDGRLQAYGWSLPPKSPQKGASKNDPDSGKVAASNVPVPVPVYCRPLMEKEPGMKVIKTGHREGRAIKQDCEIKSQIISDMVRSWS